MKRWRLAFLILAAAIAAGAAYAAVWLRHGFSARDNPSWIEAFAAQAARSMAIPATYRMKNPYPPTPENLREAEEHFADHCSTCHGNDGSGDTLFGRGLYPKPPDMRAGETQTKSDGELYYVIENGVRLTGMPAFGQDHGTNDAETWKLVLFIRHLPQLSAEELEQMKKMNPKTDADRAEEQQEEEFLNGGEVPKAPEAEHHH
jgi:mono/diheme cytochrome c family protein